MTSVEFANDSKPIELLFFNVVKHAWRDQSIDAQVRLVAERDLVDASAHFCRADDSNDAVLHRVVYRIVLRVVGVRSQVLIG